LKEDPNLTLPDTLKQRLLNRKLVGVVSREGPIILMTFFDYSDDENLSVNQKIAKDFPQVLPA
jgi:hypothetical protein